MSILTTASAKFAAAAAIVLSTVGCGSLPHGMGTAGGAVVGGVLGSTAGRGGTAVGVIAGAAAGRLLEAECETRTTGTATSTTNGNQTGPWRGTNTHTYDCRGTAAKPNQNLPANIPGARPDAPKPVFK